MGTQLLNYILISKPFVIITRIRVIVIEVVIIIIRESITTLVILIIV